MANRWGKCGNSDRFSWAPNITADGDCSHEIKRHLLLGRIAMTNLAAAAKSLQSCLTLCDPLDGSPPGPLVPGILQARILECVAIPFTGDLPNPGIELRSPALRADSLPLAPPDLLWKNHSFDRTDLCW